MKRKENKNNATKKYSILLLVGIVICSCTTNKSITGIYHSSKSGFEFVLQRKKFLIIDKTESNYQPFKCCDTISFGSWYKVEGTNFLSLSSPDYLNTDHINIIGNEGMKKAKDSLYFNISNPIEYHYEKFNEKYKELSYYVEISSNDADFDARLAQKKWDSNKFRIFKPDNIIINEIVIVIEPKSDMKVRRIAVNNIITMPYKVLNKKNNYFELELSSLTYKYIALLRLKETYIKFNDNKLTWEGEDFTKVIGN